MLATRGDPFTRAGWLFELKYDGYRALLRTMRERVSLLSRLGNELAGAFPEIMAAAGRLPAGCVLDGEIVVCDAQGYPQPHLLRSRARLARPDRIAQAARSTQATFYAFDALAIEGFDLRGLPLETRKNCLRALFKDTPALRVTQSVEEQGEALYAKVCELGLEGVVAKRKDAPYTAGRSRNWIKIKCAGYRQPAKPAS